ncbi:MAG: hypothetical protein ACI4ED_02145 [Suilimivivens sp.]
MNRNLTFAANMLAEILNYIIFVSLQVLVFIDFIKMWPGTWRVSCLVLVPICYYLVREFCSNAVLFFMLHMLPVAGVIMLYGRVTSEKAVFGVIAVVCALISISRKLSGRPAAAEAILPPAATGIFFAVYLADSLQGKGICASYVMQLMILYMLLYFLYFYLMQFIRYMDVNNRTTEHIPMSRAFHLSFGLLTGYIAILTMVICLLADRQLADRIAAALGSVLKTIIAFCFSLFPNREAETDTAIFGAAAADRMDPLPVEDVSPSFLVQILDVLLIFMACVVAIILFMAVMIGFIRLVKSVFGGRKKEKREENAKERDRIESLILPERKEKKKVKEPGFRLLRTPEQAIRRQYIRTIDRKYRMMKEEKARKLIRSGTARECGTWLFQEKKREAEEFTALYEKARYSKETCNREDLRQIKRLSAWLIR